VKHPDFFFKIINKTQVDVDFQRKRVVISCITKDGKSVHFETDYETIEQLHQQIQQQILHALLMHQVKHSYLNLNGQQVLVQSV